MANEQQQTQPQVAIPLKSRNPYACSTTYSWSSIDWSEYAKC